MPLRLLPHLLVSTIPARWSSRLAISALTIAVINGFPFGARMLVAQANTPKTAPESLKTLISNVDAAANSRQMSALLRYYSPNFTNSDGFDEAGLSYSLDQFWQTYSNVQYSTTLESWKQVGNGYTADTVTKITGTQQVDGKIFNLRATVKSRQKIVGGKILQQQILQERSQISSGAQPPTIDLTLPEKLQTNAEYSLDAIVKEPLAEDVLMGATIEQPVSLAAYTQPTNYKLELLAAGGLFKVARAPGKSGDYWISTIVVRATGMTTLTQRVHVTKGR